MLFNYLLYFFFLLATVVARAAPPLANSREIHSARLLVLPVSGLLSDVPGLVLAGFFSRAAIASSIVFAILSTSDCSVIFLPRTTGYQVQYSASSKFSKAKTVTVVKNTTVSKKISKLSGKKKYYVRVRTYKTVKINGKSIRIYSGWSKAKTVTTKK